MTKFKALGQPPGSLWREGRVERGRGNQMGFGISVPPVFVFPVRFLAIERLFQATLTKVFAAIRDSQRIDLKGITNGFIRPMETALPAIRFEQDSGAAQFAGRGIASANQFFQVRSFFGGELHEIFLVIFTFSLREFLSQNASSVPTLNFNFDSPLG
ncbi:MAG: hypothetical protein M1358_22145 [Chloroflexi bacterium]|nr:hypothetical protein [Chloroflexota bacterium]